MIVQRLSDGQVICSTCWAKEFDKPEPVTGWVAGECDFCKRREAAALLGRKGGKARAGRPAAVAASRENGKKGGAPRQPRYTLTTGAYTWEHLTMRDLVKIVLKKWPDHEWPEDDREFLDELNSLDPQGVRAEEEGR